MSLKAKNFELLKRRLRQLGYKDNVDSYSSETIDALLGDLVRLSKAYQDCRRDPVGVYDFAETDSPSEDRFRFKNLSRENEELNGRLIAMKQDEIFRESELRRYKALAESASEEMRKARNLLEAENAHLRSQNIELKQRFAQLLKDAGSRGRDAEVFRDLLARLNPAREEPPAPRNTELIGDLTRQLRQTREESGERAQLVELYSKEISRLRAKVGYFEKLQRSLVAAEALALEQRQLLQAQEEKEQHIDSRKREARPLAELLKQIDTDVLKIKSSLANGLFPATQPAGFERPAGASKTHKSSFYKPSARPEFDCGDKEKEKGLKKENEKLLGLVYKLCADKDKIIESLLSKGTVQAPGSKMHMDDRCSIHYAKGDQGQKIAEPNSASAVPEKVAADGGEPQAPAQ